MTVQKIRPGRSLLPEEDAIGDSDDDDDGQDDTLPADLWYAWTVGLMRVARAWAGRVCNGTYTFTW